LVVLDGFVIQLFVPAVRVYSFTDTIPFHLQLRAPVSSLRAFLQPTFISHTKGNKTVAAAPPPRGMSTTPIVRVFLYRQISVEIRGQRVWRTCVLGEGALHAVPPSQGRPFDNQGYATLDWEGEVRCEEDPGAGGFNAGKLKVKVSLRLKRKLHNF
jgi:hypothetical protein